MRRKKNHSTPTFLTIKNNFNIERESQMRLRRRIIAGVVLGIIVGGIATIGNADSYKGEKIVIRKYLDSVDNSPSYTPTNMGASDVEPVSSGEGTELESEEITIAGITGETIAAIISTAGDPYLRVGSGSWVKSSPIVNGESIKLKATVPSANTALTVRYKVGSREYSWVVNGQDTTPDNFVFNELNGQARNTLVESEATINGITGSVTASVAGDGEIAVSSDGGSTYGAYGTSQSVSNGNIIKARMRTSTLYLTSKTINITVGTVSKEFKTTTVDDTDAPQISNIVGLPEQTSTKNDYLTFTIIYNEMVKVSGTPSVKFTLGSTEKSAACYIGCDGSSTDTLGFRYEVVEGDNDADGITIAGGEVINLNGGTIKDLLNNNALLSYSAQSYPLVKIDTVPATFTSMTAPAGYYKSGMTLPVTVQFSKNLGTLTGTATMTVKAGPPTAGTGACTVSGTSLLCNVAITAGNTPTPQGLISFSDVNGLKDYRGIVVDVSNLSTLKAIGGGAVLDNAAPTISAATITPSSGVVGTGTTPTFTVTYSDANAVAVDNGGSNSNIKLNYLIGSTAKTATFSGYNSGTKVLSFTADSATQSGDNGAITLASSNTITLSGTASIKDPAGNDGARAYSATGATVDTAPPVWSSPDSGSLGNIYNNVAIQPITLTATDTTSVSYSLKSGYSLPTGLSISGNTIVGTPNNAVTTIAFYINAIDAGGSSSERYFTFNVANDPCASSPSVGTICGNGTIYVGTCDGKKYYVTGSTANDGLSTFNNGTTSLVTPVTSSSMSLCNGLDNTISLVNASNSNTPYYPANTCYYMVAHGKDDWFLPSLQEAYLISAWSRSYGSSQCGPYYWSGYYQFFWTSTGNGGTGILTYDCVNAGGNGQNPYSSYPFRCIRKE